MSMLLMVLCLAMLAATLAVKVAACPPGRVRRPVYLAGLAVAGAVALLFLAPSVASAVSDTPPSTGIESGSDSLFELDAAVVNVILGVLIPIVNGLLTKLSTSSAVKAILNLALVSAAALLNTSLTENGDAVLSRSLILNAAMTFIVAATTYTNLWKPLQVTSSPVTVTDDNGERIVTAGRLATIGVH